MIDNEHQRTRTHASIAASTASGARRRQANGNTNEHATTDSQGSVPAVARNPAGGWCGLERDAADQHGVSAQSPQRSIRSRIGIRLPYSRRQHRAHHPR